MTRRKFISALRQVFQFAQEAVIHYLTEELKFAMKHLEKRPKPTEGEKTALARAAKAVDPIYLEKTFNLFTPATLTRWHRELVRKKWDYSRLNKKPGRPRINRELEELVVKLALENPNDGYQTLVGRLKLLGFEGNSETIQNILKRNGISPSPERKGQLTWKEFLDTHWEDLAATDFLTWEVLTPFGLVSYYVLFFIRHLDRKVHIAGVTTHPNEDWMQQVARNLTDPEWGPSSSKVEGVLPPGTLLLHDRDTKYTAHFDKILNESGVDTLKLPARSPNTNAHAERFVRSIKQECLSRMIITSEEQLRKALREYLEYYNHERCHQGLGNRIPQPMTDQVTENGEGKIRRKQRLGGLLNFYFRDESRPKLKRRNEKTAA